MNARYLVAWRLMALLGCAVLVGAAGCQQGEQAEQEAAQGTQEKAEGTMAEEAEGQTPPFGTEADVERAQALWNEMEGYAEDWEPYPGMSGWQEGKSPHGDYLRYYVNAVALEDTETFQDGAVIVKENYSAESEDALKSVTVMQKVEGYDPDNQDWFWVKYAPDGEVMANEKDMKLAGRVAKGMEKGCIACHAAAGGGDYVFAND